MTTEASLSRPAGPSRWTLYSSVNDRPVPGGRKSSNSSPRLADEIGAVGEKQNAPELRMVEQPMAEHASGVRLAGAGRHLDQRARAIGGERGFETRHGIDLAFAQALGQQRRHRLQPLAHRRRVGEPAPQCLGAVKEEHAARSRRRVGMVAKQDLGAGGDVFEADLPLAPDEMLGDAAHVARRLVREARKGRAFGLCLDDAAQSPADEQGIVNRARSRRELAHSDAEPGATVHPLARLYQPTSLNQLTVDRHPCPVFGMENVLPRLCRGYVNRRYFAS